MKPNFGVSPMSVAVCIVDSRLRLRKSGLFNLHKLLVGGLSDQRITDGFGMSPKRSPLHEAQGRVYESITPVILGLAVQNEQCEKVLKL